MTDTQSRYIKFASFLLGAAVPLLGYVLCSKTSLFQCGKKERVDKAHDITVEDSFPASDPPSAW